MIDHQQTRASLRHLAEGYAWVMLLPSARAGVVFLLATFAMPGLGFAGLVGAVSALGVARWMRVEDSLVSVYVFNGLLTGLLLAAHYVMGLHLIILVACAAALAGLLTGWSGVALWRFSQLPVLSLPFVLSAWCAQLAAGSYAMLSPLPVLAALPTEPIGWSEAFFSTLGSVFSQPDARVGILLFIVLCLGSRTLAFLAVTGFAIGVGWQALFEGNWVAGLVPDWSYNPMLAAMATGALFVVPGRAGFVLGCAAAALAAFLSVTLTHLLLPIGLTPLALPFLLSTWLCLYAAQRSGRPATVGARVQLPETTLEQTRLARARLGDASSVGLMPPFMGEWQVSQGPNGQHTHRGIWREALDFIVTENERSFDASGMELENFFCFGLPVVSPCYGQVVRIENEVPDNSPGAVNLRENWGNFILIRLHQDAYVLLAHLRQSSVTVKVGDWLQPGQALGQCGNSGRSPQPHLHLSVVKSAAPEAETLPFHLTGTLLRHENADAAFHLWANPAQGDRVAAAWSGALRPIALKVGSGLAYRVRTNEGAWHTWRLTPQLSLDGRFRLVSDSGAECWCEENGAVFACYGRSSDEWNRERDLFFDLWLLAAGCTPASEQATQWRDAPPARLLPGLWRWLGTLLWPIATQVKAVYFRSWDSDALIWRQSGKFSLLGRHVMDIEAGISAERGLTYLNATGAGQRWEMELGGAFQTGDEGVPEREWTISVQEK
jgi:urea transporter